MKRLLAILATLWVASPALAVDARPAAVGLKHSCVQLTMCTAEADTGICLDGDASNIVAFRPEMYSWVFNSTQSVGTWSCNVITNDVGATVTGFDYTIPGITLTETASVAWFDGFLHHFWINCSAIGTTVTVTATGCPLK
jgi:hypothetical protein